MEDLKRLLISQHHDIYYDTFDFIIKDILISNHLIRIQQIKEDQNKETELDELQIQRQTVLNNNNISYESKQEQLQQIAIKIHHIIEQMQHNEIINKIKNVNDSVNNNDHKYWRYFKNQQKINQSE